MTAQIFLIAPPDTDAPTCLKRFDEAIAAAPVAVLLLPRGARSEGQYKTLVKAVAPRAQAAGVAVLIEGDPGLVRTLGADGLHVEGSISEVKAATQALKPDYIVGAGRINVAGITPDNVHRLCEAIAATQPVPASRR